MGADIYNSFAMHGIDIIKGYIKEYPSLLEENALLYSLLFLETLKKSFLLIKFS